MGPAGMSLNWREKPPIACWRVGIADAGSTVPYLLNNISDGKQLLGGVSGLGQRRVVIVAGDHRAEPGVQVGACRAVNTQVLHSHSLATLKKKEAVSK